MTRTSNKGQLRRMALLVILAASSFTLEGCILTQLLGGLGGGQAGQQPLGAGTPPGQVLPGPGAPLNGPVTGALPATPGTTPGTPGATLTPAQQAQLASIDQQIAARQATIQRSRELVASYTQSSQNLERPGKTARDVQQQQEYAQLVQQEQQKQTQLNSELTRLQAQRQRVAAGQAA